MKLTQMAIMRMELQFVRDWNDRMKILKNIQDILWMQKLCMMNDWYLLKH